MPNIALNGFGYNATVQLDGNVIWDWTRPPVIFLFAEAHGNRDVIAENLANACRLIDAGVVAFAAVEERFSNDPFAVVTQFVQGLGAASLQAYSDDLFQQHVDDAGIIAASKANAAPMSFARVLLYLRPAVNVVSVEDPHLASVADLENQHIAQQGYNDSNGSPLAGAALDRYRLGIFRHLEVNRQRELAFIYRTYEGYVAKGAAHGVILNLGGYHHRHVSRLFAMMRQPCVWVKAPSYHDALP